ncbi:unnamed protein product [Mytilus coruscus]|uniref:MEGF10_11 n=1 Tax=Mytilus coruscus TaxID=42192 RepID=A0A6J8A0H7_MYTCO|nr:unnamed protein product [Mytilus coruscus]
MEWIVVYVVFLLFSTVQATTPTPGVCQIYRRIRNGVSYTNVKVAICCNNHYMSNDKVCVECPIGQHSKGEVCTKCEDGLFGRKCSFTCNCNPTERCDHVKGCVPKDMLDVETRTVVPTDKSPNSNPQETEVNNVVIYMTCVAVGSVLIVVFGLIIKNSEATCRRKPSNKVMKTEIKKRKWSNFSFGKANVKDKKESLYADINEKYMLNFDGE